MRVSSLAWLWLAVPAAVAGFAACGGVVTDVTGTSGNTGSGGAGGGAGDGGFKETAVVSTGGLQTTVGPSVTTGTGLDGTTVGPSVTASSGGGSACDQACSHAAQCGTDICNQFKIDCNNVSPMYDCVLECVGQLPCDQLNQQNAFACYQKCQNAGTTTGTGMAATTGTGMGTSVASSSASGGSTFQCNACSAQKCGMQLQQCAGDQQCGQWLQCIQGCNQNPSPACADKCDMTFPNAAAKYTPVYECSCTSCSSQCSNLDPCSHVPQP